MKSLSLRIPPTASMTRRIQHPGTVVQCVSGAWQSFRIHWQKPQPGADVSQTSEPLVNGEAYLGPNGPFREFWITTGPGLPDPREDIQLRVLDTAMPVVQLNTRRFDGYKLHNVHEQVLALTHPSTTTLYTTDVQEADPATGEIILNDRGHVIPRGFIAGGVTSNSPITVRIYANLDASINYYAEIAKWHCDLLDGKNRYSASFEQGGRSAFNAAGTNSYNGPGLIAWPARGIQVTIQTMTADVLNGWIWIASRTGHG